MESEDTMANQGENAAQDGEKLEMTEGEEPAAIGQTEAQGSAATRSATETSEHGGEAPASDSSASELFSGGESGETDSGYAGDLEGDSDGVGD